MKAPDLMNDHFAYGNDPIYRGPMRENGIG